MKRLLLPLWNGGHRLAWLAGEYAEALARRRFGRCAVCGRWGPMRFRRWVIRPELERRSGASGEVADAWARKESCFCSWCGSTLRARRIAQAILALFPVGHPPAPLPSIREWVGTLEAKALLIAEVNTIEGLHQQLTRLPGLAYSDYIEGAEPGAIVEGVRSERLERLTYQDNHFDLIVSSETLEHVPDFPSALSEILRVLKPGGRHLFTVPLLPGVPETFVRAVLRPDGTLDHRATPIAHPGGNWGYPVFTEFGADFPALLEAAGFEVEVFFGPVREEDVAQVFSCRKPLGGGETT